MRAMRVVFLAATMLGCAATPSGPGGSGQPDAGGGNPPPGQAAWSIQVDMSGLDRYVTGGATTWAVGGRATASEGLAGVDVAGAAATLDGQGVFAGTAAPAAGVTVVPVVASDTKGNLRKGHRALISAAFAPEGSFARDAAGLVLTDELLAAMAGPLAGDAASIDVASEIAARPTLSVDDRCTTWPVYAEQDPTEIQLEVDSGQLWLLVRVPGLYVYFEGECDGLFSTIPIAGEMAMDVEARTQLDAKPGAECLVGFDHTTPAVELPGFYFDVWGTGGALSGWMVELGSSGKAEEAHDQFQSEFTTRSDELLGERLADIVVFDRQETMDMLGQPVDVHLCLGGLGEEGGQLVARIASISSTPGGAGSREAPGAPQLGGPLAAAGASELLLDAEFVGRLLFSSWRSGGLSKPNVQEVDFGLISLIARDLVDLYPDATVVSVSIDAELPPVVTTSPLPGADLRIDIADLMVDLSIGEDRIFRFGTRLTLDLDLVPDGAGLVPTVVETEAEVHLLDEIVDAPDEAMESSVKSRLGDSAATLLGGASLKLPELPGLGAPANVTPDPAGRFLHITLN